ncbi:hypothetical protein [Actinomycetospora sp. NBRC 106378]|uniref:hypothetical protein n=1 Tax=Actinomycetospora sp. NBRC 106378 TaxID=3032208 RepID=UPI0024A4553E|nr:hypothetical protein [Actinomycetospora sp. NBRC 106378]GLZ51509.1 hypothetical protein Acsp07_11260 [Actinomycetospora sp. NBRC 106378]
MGFADVPYHQGPRDLERRKALQNRAATVIAALEDWTAAGVRDEVLVAIRYHAEHLCDLSEGAPLSPLACRAHAYGLAALLSFLDATQAGHLATDLFEIIAEWTDESGT